MKNHKEESYSVLMSVYEKESPENLRQAVTSMLNQTRKPDDFVLVCDGTLNPGLYGIINEFTEKYASLFQVVYLEKNQGLGPALNTGLLKCRNELVARMDSDDIADKERCRRQTAFFEENPQCDVLSGTIKEFDGTPETITATKTLPDTPAKLRKYSRKRNPINHPCVMYRKSKVLEAGSYQPFYLFEDYYLWIRMLMRGCSFYNLPEVLLYLRADSQMYRRRGGIRYLKAMLRFKKYLYSQKYISFFEL